MSDKGMSVGSVVQPLVTQWASNREMTWKGLGRDHRRKGQALK